MSVGKRGVILVFQCPHPGKKKKKSHRFSGKGDQVVAAREMTHGKDNSF